MKTSFELTADFRDDQGKGASRRLRRAGRVPAILYGGKRDPRALSLDHAKLQLALDNEKFYSSIVSLKVGDQTQAAILRDLQRHPWKSQIVHADFQRVFDDETIRITVPLHFLNQETAPGVKTEGGMVSHLKNDLLVECLPKDLPEFISVDIGALHLNQALKISDLKLPAGVVSVELEGGKDATVVSVHALRAEAEETPAAAAAEAAAREMAQMELAYHLAVSKRDVRGDAALNATDHQHLRRSTALNTARMPVFQPLVPPAASCNLAAPNPPEMLSEVRRRLGAVGLSPCVLDLTHPALGIPAVRVICPGLEQGMASSPGPRLRAAAHRAGVDPSAIMPL